MPRDRRRVIILGSTGSIGTQTLVVIDHLNALHARGEWRTRYEVVGLAARRGTDQLAQQSARFNGSRAAVGAEDSERLVREVECDLVVAAMSGSAGLAATFRAVDLGRHVALANKETLVAAGELVVAAAERTGARLLPIDSEHSGLWQLLSTSDIRHPTSDIERPAPPLAVGPSVFRVILTASGGPFRTWPAQQTYDASPEQALNHPTWSMGPKVTVDSASLMNKALEIIEARWLFGLAADRIRVLIHPQSIIHAIVEFADGSSLAQLGAPDMRTPIQFALTFPDRAAAPGRRLSWDELRALEFETPDDSRFPALALAYRALGEGGTAGAILNAANEAAVEAFLAGTIPFGRITELVRSAMDAIAPAPLRTLTDATGAASRSREHVRAAIPS
jgi:1-deoxy-D-xylulose-5-phosphate reductoisomerase